MERTDRTYRQAQVSSWVQSTWGYAVATSRQERAMRLLEEAIELVQAEHIHMSRVFSLAKHVYSKPVGNPAQEVGGISITLLAYCNALGINADDTERQELERVLSLPAEHFRERQAKKAAAGVAMEPNTDDWTGIAGPPPKGELSAPAFDATRPDPDADRKTGQMHLDRMSKMATGNSVGARGRALATSGVVEPAPQPVDDGGPQIEQRGASKLVDALISGGEIPHHARKQ
jgi:hypothetical protein